MISVQLTPIRPERKFHRKNVSTVAGYRSGMIRATVEIADLSVAGLKIVTASPMSVGSRIWIRIPMLEPQECVIAWVDGCTAGCRFEKPLHPAVLDVLVQTHAAGR
ncbi:PilZ domain-containing protein [Sphingosinicella rhizophila]|uniref:PilZ domain-containing protein n=1 Tax=Sphingosinicella rhizophila TaxID=3050082 RepID=A0ABU3Q7C9_9SPHN|nr:PilZ domain-containing protein [Sphingosinicella sp. GR2756]MDT9599301.1 PilZ domain-containing protein [Sphingosinicella sp. GR2756]